MWSDEITRDEIKYSCDVIAELQSVTWVNPLLRTLEEQVGPSLKEGKGLEPEQMPLLFEARFAYELYSRGISAKYEYGAGVGDSTIDFMFKSPTTWLTELVSIRASDAAKAAIREINTGVYEQILSTNASDRRQSQEGEMIKAQEKIGEKVFATGRPTKFPKPTDSLHVIVADFRGYLDDPVADINDYLEIAFGARAIPPEYSWTAHYWEINGERLPIKGLFEKSNPLRFAKYLRERIHFLCFVTELEYRKGEISEKACYFANPHLFAHKERATEAFKQYPFYRDGALYFF